MYNAVEEAKAQVKEIIMGASGESPEVSFIMRKMGLEPTRPCEH